MKKIPGYSMPFLPPKTKKLTFWLLLLMLLLILLIGILECQEMMANGVLKNLKSLVLLCGLAVAYLCLLGTCFAKLRFAPDGIWVTLFGITLKYHSAARIRLITAVRYHDFDRIALCNYSLEELESRAYYSNPELLRDSRECWVGEWTYEYLRRKHPSQRDRLPDRLIYWIWWDPERAQTLRNLYPQAQWVDFSKDKIFDKQLEEYSSQTPKRF